MLRFVTALLLVFAFAAQTFQQTALLLDYYINTASFAKACENKARPALHCNGKCQLLKKQQAEEKQDKQNGERKNEPRPEVHSSCSYFTIISFAPTFFKTPYPPIRTCEACTDRAYAIFHPPAVA